MTEILSIRLAEASDAPSIAEIYNHYVCHTIITFEEDPVTSEEFAARIESTRASGMPWFICEIEGRVVGYSVASEWRRRVAYRFTVESAVYVANNQSGKGIGTRLYEALFRSLEQSDVHSVIGGISLPNAASVRLHERFGFKKIAEYSQVGWKMGRWIDVGFWQLMINHSTDPPSC